jgi:quercetin dioxygenase-like cupin family protein
MPHIDLLYKTAIVNCPGKTIVATQVNFSPHASTPPHTHAGAFVSAYVVSGHILNKMNDDPMRLLGPGESFAESPTCKHKICENASDTEPARVLATLILDTERLDKIGVDGLVVIEEEYKEVVLEAQKQKNI